MSIEPDAARYSDIDDNHFFQSFALIKEITNWWFIGDGKNYPLFHDYLWTNGDLNVRCIAAADLLESARRAVEEFKKRQRNNSIKALDVFGVFQALVAQQDAVNVLWKILLKQIVAEDNFAEEIKKSPFWRKEDDLKRVRRFRNEIIGHPTDLSKQRAATNIMRIDENNYIMYAVCDVSRGSSGSSLNHPRVDIQECLKQQDLGLLKYLKQILQAVKMSKPKSG